MKIKSAYRFYLLLAFSLLLGVAILQPVSGQTTTTGTTTSQPTLNQILQSLGGLGSLGNLGQLTSGTTTGTTTGTTGTTTTQPSGGRQPAIITNQFNTTQSGSLQARAPGLMVQQGIAEHNGTLTITGQPEQEDWLKQTGQMIALAIVQEVQGVLTTINTGIASLSGFNVASGSGSSSGSTSSTITNPATTGAGTSTPIDKSH